MIGYPVGPCRRPFNTLSEEAIAALTKVLEDSVAAGLH